MTPGMATHDVSTWGFCVRERSLPSLSAAEFQPSSLSPSHHRARMHGANRRNAVRRMRKSISYCTLPEYCLAMRFGA
jgi:hypothetical protein